MGGQCKVMWHLTMGKLKRLGSKPSRAGRPPPPPPSLHRPAPSSAGGSRWRWAPRPATLRARSTQTLQRGGAEVAAARGVAHGLWLPARCFSRQAARKAARQCIQPPAASQPGTRRCRPSPRGLAAAAAPHAPRHGGSSAGGSACSKSELMERAACSEGTHPCRAALPGQPQTS